MRLTLKQYTEKVYRPDRFNDKAKYPLRVVNTTVKQFCEFVGCDPKLLDITPKQVEGFVEHCKETICSANGARKKFNAIMAILKHAKHPSFPDRRIHNGLKMVSLKEKPTGGTKLKDVFDNLYKPQKLRGKSVHTIRMYRCYIQELSVFLGYWATLEDLNDSTLSEYLDWAERQPTRNGSKRTARTINNRRSYVLCFWNWCARKRLVELFPDVEKLPESSPPPKAWQAEQLADLMKAVDETEGEVDGIPAAAWWRALHLVLWDTGERISATLAIRWEWLDGSLLSIPGSVRKGGRKSMTYHLKPETLAALEAIREPHREVVFPFRFKCVGSLYHRYNEILARAGLPTDRASKFHRIRRTFASFIEAAGGNATDALDHSRRSVTKESYLDPKIVKPKPANELLFSIAGG